MPSEVRAKAITGKAMVLALLAIDSASCSNDPLAVLEMRKVSAVIFSRAGTAGDSAFKAAFHSQQQRPISCRLETAWLRALSCGGALQTQRGAAQAVHAGACAESGLGSVAGARCADAAAGAVVAQNSTPCLANAERAD